MILRGSGTEAAEQPGLEQGNPVFQHGFVEVELRMVVRRGGLEGVF
ncbi:hypothetical protein IYQ_03407 [Aeromonas salmonicida subsp. salmonicida 01-B526]|uniref:Uncharacterized protein n=1 Tax=Aeromonas salmonicida subsp. salmonicida 01-B526 TaxID=1076135 RepID=A0ABN0E3T5_AERSS|nr:hypothetical protein IYQ_03407 [Aeromonas salmonicida subsp. salmonicida 01-B526]